MAVTITRTNWIDDDGSGTTGTVLNNAMKTGLYNEIDTALAKVAQLAGGNAFTGNQSIAGALTVTTAASAFQFAGASDVSVTIRNTQAGAAARAILMIGNDSISYMTALVSNASTFASAAPSFANGSELTAYGNGGLSITTQQPTPIRFYTGNAERMRIAATGEVCLNSTATVGGGRISIQHDQGQGQVGITFTALSAALGSPYLVFYNNAFGVAGTITQATATTVSFNTTSDARLKDDDGRATDIAALRAVVVHDFTWKADGVRARGVFAQEAADVFPAAITVGTDDTTDDGVTLARPWMTDYSKFVPDLIVGWQQHDAELTQLRAALATLKGSH